MYSLVVVIYVLNMVIRLDDTITKVYKTTRISLPIGTNGKLLAAIEKFPHAISKLMIGKILATNAEEITNAMIGNATFAIYW